MPRPDPSTVLHPRLGSRTGMTAESLLQGFADSLFFEQARFPEVATWNDYYLALAHTVRDRLLHRWAHTAHTYFQQHSRTVCYFSAEFLLGPHLGNNLLNLGIYPQAREAMEQAGLVLCELLEQEEEPGLGNGGLGRLAACYMDSLATLEIPAIGYGIRYEFGIFDQNIKDGWQEETTDKWLRYGNPWEIARPELAFDVKLGGHTVHERDEQGHLRVSWVPERVVKGVAFDTPILGYRVNTVNLLRLWKAEATECFDFQAFNVGDYYGAVEEKLSSENLTKVLYPNDEAVGGKRLRLEQQYFFVACSLQDMVRIHLQDNANLDTFHEKYAAQLNDTHPSIGIVELMRVLLDEHYYEWQQAWDITRQTFAYTNHTLLPEALEKWPIALFGAVLPRHLELIYEINRRFLEEIRARYPQDEAKMSRMSIIDEMGERYVRMAHLACVGSHAINGVAKLHSELLKQDVLRDFHGLWPEKFTNVTNGVTPRRFLGLANPGLADLISAYIGADWLNHLDHLRKLEPLAHDPVFCQAWRQVKEDCKIELAGLVLHRVGIQLDPLAMFDIQVKRIHEYKRQHLSVLHIITLYNRILRNPQAPITPRAFIFGGKAAPGYFMAKLIIRLIHGVADVINRDPLVNNRLKVIFFPDFNVKNAQRIYPAADLSEQISTAGKEASGTGNMKFSMNGALTIGTLDGANIEIREQVGAENFFLFGLSASQVSELQRQGYHPWQYYQDNNELKEAVDAISSGQFSRGDRNLFKPLVDSLLAYDPYLLLADYPSYIECQEQVSLAYQNPDTWTRMSILNVARMGYFSSDRAIGEYCQNIWRVQPVPIQLTKFAPGTTHRT